MDELFVTGMQDDRYEVHINPGFGKKRFSTQEVQDILISIIVLTVAFMILYRNNTIMTCLEYHLGEGGRWAGLFAICLVLVVLSFLLHEFGHKFMAQKYGMWSEFRMFPMGLVLTLVTSIFGFLFAAPGAVYIKGYADPQRNGKISMAGPTVNVILAAFGIAAALIIGSGPFYINDVRFLAVLVCVMFASLNSFLAVFNLIPIGPLDGGKILAWNKVVWVTMFAIAVIELVIVYTSIDIMYYPFPGFFH